VTRLTEAEYQQRASSELLALRAAIDRLELDEVQAELQGEVLLIEFWDDTQFVLNAHSAARQIWMAADRQAWHFSWDAQRQAWLAQTTQDELWATVVRAVSAKLGRRIELGRPV
jgi:CyaY protein